MHWTNGKWRTTPARAFSPPSSLSAATDGTLWLIDEGKLWRRHLAAGDNGEFSPVRLPQIQQPGQPAMTLSPKALTIEMAGAVYGWSPRQASSHALLVMDPAKTTAASLPSQSLDGLLPPSEARDKCQL